MAFPKTVKGYLSKLKELDDSPGLLNDFDNLSEYQQEVLSDVRAYIASAIDRLENKLIK
jgi:hypothetical protein